MLLVTLTLELAQESQIVLKIESQVVDAGLYHMGAFDAQSKGKTAELIGIDAVCLEDVGMD